MWWGDAHAERGGGNEGMTRMQKETAQIGDRDARGSMGKEGVEHEMEEWQQDERIWKKRTNTTTQTSFSSAGKRKHHFLSYKKPTRLIYKSRQCSLPVSEKIATELRVVPTAKCAGVLPEAPHVIPFLFVYLLLLFTLIKKNEIANGVQLQEAQIV